ncbi:MAG: serine protease [Thiohalocapsa sp.]|jgi:S1-C subfamily serine protease|uniref:S1C family serine protease n=1 Tax=Thiohalocapsa sp. TaxID=2497641 RepID=UPI0025D46AB2|nr:serine protease [Thiohalocapsa sp.]MCG6940251.1 serine protease [Thiohalocapsa sp.]
MPYPMPLRADASRAADLVSALVRYLVLLLAVAAGPVLADLPATAAKMKQSVVAVGTYMAVRATQQQPRGTGFVVAPSYVVTNAHVVPRNLDAGRRETIAIYRPVADHRTAMRPAKLVAIDREHDLALLRFEGAALPAVSLGRTTDIQEGQWAAFTGYPLVNALWLFPATHRATVAAIAPIAAPVGSGKELTPEMIKRLSAPFNILQLDATAYPGSSGSPLYDVDTGRVLGVINSVYVKNTRESAIKDPSGITYAIPVDYVRNLMNKAGVR